MLPVPEYVRRFLFTNYGVSPNSSMFISRNEPQKVYVEHNGTLHFVDFSSPYKNPSSYSLNSVTSRDSAVPKADVEGHDINTGSPAVESPGWHSMSDAEREILQKDFDISEYRKANAYKTALCQAYKESGYCCYGSACRFAHGEQELRLPPQTHPKYKTQLCNKFALFGRCPYGPRCQFIHQRPNNIVYRRPIQQTSTEDGNNRSLLIPLSEQKPSHLSCFTERNNLQDNVSNEDINLNKVSSSLPFVPRSDNVEFTSSLTSFQLDNAISPWRKLGANSKVPKTELLKENDDLESSIKKLENLKIDNGSCGSTDISAPLNPWFSTAFDNWGFESENEFAQSCFPRLNVSSPWSNATSDSK